MNRRLLISICFALLAVIVSPALGTPSPACVTESGISLCVQFDNLPNTPDEPNDFEVTFDSNHVPSVDLKKGRNGQGTLYQWRVWCKDTNNSDAPANIGTISGTTNYDFDVKVLSASGGQGAASVGGINLDPSGSDKYSRLATGNIGELTGNLTLQKSNGGSGGDISSFAIQGDVSSSSTITVPVLTDMTIYGDVAGTINNTGSVTDLAIGDSGGISSTGQINLGQMDNSHIYCFGPIEGDLSLSDDIDANSSIQLNGDVTSTATIDLNGHDVAGGLRFYHTLSGQVIEGGTISGDVALAYGSGVFEGAVTFDNVTDTGQIRTTHYNDLNGTIHIEGDVVGDIHHFGNMGSTGSIEIGGYLAGDIGLAGDLESGGLIQIGSLEDSGRILIDGLCSGAIDISGLIGQNSLIRAIGGLPSSGSIKISTSGYSSVSSTGTIHIGATSTSTPLPSVPFDGLICLNCQWRAGTLRYIGCDDDSTAPNVCVNGNNTSTFDFTQTGCTYTISTTPSCVSSCP